MVLGAVLLGVGGVVAAPVVADWLGVGGVEVRQEPPPTTLVPSGGEALDLGRRTTLSRASVIAGFEVAVPAQLGQPDEVWIDRSHVVPVVWLAYRARPGLPEASVTGYGALLAQAKLAVAEDLWATKFVEPGRTIERVEVGTGRALWVQGTHFIGLRDNESGEIAGEELRLSDSVLLWERGQVTLRLESMVGRDDSVRIARSTR